MFNHCWGRPWSLGTVLSASPCDARVALQHGHPQLSGTLNPANRCTLGEMTVVRTIEFIKINIYQHHAFTSSLSHNKLLSYANTSINACWLQGRNE